MASIELSLWRPLCLHSATTATLEPPWQWFCLQQQLWSFKEGTRVVLQQLHRNRTFWVLATTERPNHFHGRTKVARRSQPCVKGPLITEEPCAPCIYCPHNVNAKLYLYILTLNTFYQGVWLLIHTLASTALCYTAIEITLAWVMAWCRQATSHYLNQCWLITNSCCYNTFRFTVCRRQRVKYANIYHHLCLYYVTHFLDFETSVSVLNFPEDI